ncbi:MAG: penicillin acylase family protein [Bauldia litoralis]
MEMMRRIASGRLAEVAGPLATDIDIALRMIDFGRVAEKAEREMPPETRAFVEAFVAGINHYQFRAERLPHEFRVLSMRREKWTVRDVITVGRLAGTDVNWLVWFRLLQLRDRKDWPQIWATLTREGSDSLVSFGLPKKAETLDRLLRGYSKNGSNSVAISGSRTGTGAALIANDPHLGITVPNLWLVAGVKSPSYHAVGLMVPGLPFIAVGRNPWIAWGGTNMRAASSDLYDVSGLPPAQITTRRERIRVRWWGTRTVDIRETPLGPVISDAPPLGWKGKPLALRWIGHERGDEITAFLKVSQARDWSQFRRAFATFAVSAQNMLYADAKGNIGQVMATMLPVRPNRQPPDLVLDARDPAWQWQGVRTALDLPSAYNPAAGFLASANNKPTFADFPIGYFFSADDRIARMKQLLDTGKRVGVGDLRRLQRDVYMPSSVALRDAALAKLDAAGPDGLDAPARKVLELMRSWDGRYTTDSRGAVAFELFAVPLTQAHFAARYDGKAQSAMIGFSRSRRMVTAAVEAAPPERIAPMLRAALTSAGAKIGSIRDWGSMHRLRLSHPLSFIPLIGNRYRFADYPARGSSETLQKTAHDPATGKHATRYGQQARHISDMADPDANWFTLLGGQDGWLSSTTAFDQVKLWREGKYVKVPLRLETVRKAFTHKTALKPRAR